MQLALKHLKIRGFFNMLKVVQGCKNQKYATKENYGRLFENLKKNIIINNKNLVQNPS